MKGPPPRPLGPGGSWGWRGHRKPVPRVALWRRMGACRAPLRAPSELALLRGEHCSRKRCAFIHSLCFHLENQLRVSNSFQFCFALLGTRPFLTHVRLYTSWPVVAREPTACPKATGRAEPTRAPPAGGRRCGLQLTALLLGTPAPPPLREAWVAAFHPSGKKVLKSSIYKRSLASESNRLRSRPRLCCRESFLFPPR